MANMTQEFNNVIEIKDITSEEVSKITTFVLNQECWDDLEGDLQLNWDYLRKLLGAVKYLKHKKD